jgi:Holliday junction resolvasome RuvABC endonuclease subunit
MAVSLSVAQKRMMFHENIIMGKRLLGLSRLEAEGKPEVVVGFDLSQAATGVSLFSLDGRLINCYEIDVRRQAKYKMHSHLRRHFEEIFRTYRPIAIAWEQISVMTEVSGLLALAQVEGCLFAALGDSLYVDNELKLAPPFLVPVSVSAVKKFVTGYGNPFKDEKWTKQYKRQKQKEAVMEEVLLKWGFQAKSDNESDAFGVGRVGLSVVQAVDNFDLGVDVVPAQIKKYIESYPKPDMVLCDLEEYQLSVTNNILLSDVIGKENEYERIAARIQKIRKR